MAGFHNQQILNSVSTIYYGSTCTNKKTSHEPPVECRQNDYSLVDKELILSNTKLSNSQIPHSCGESMNSQLSTISCWFLKALPLGLKLIRAISPTLTLLMPDITGLVGFVVGDTDSLYMNCCIFPMMLA